jgi:hypothetical protein
LPSTDDLWEALSEYPDAKKLLLEKGREILKKEEQPSLNKNKSKLQKSNYTQICTDNILQKIEVIKEKISSIL